VYNLVRIEVRRLILRKPYAFLIRKFKIIHLLLTLCSIYLVTRINGILNYYNNFINNTVGRLGAEEFFGSIYVYVAILAIVICGIIIALMKYKKKSYLFYIVLIGYFLAVSLLINYSITGLEQIYFSNIDTKTLLLHRDILRIVSLIQYIFVFMPLVRGLGFDIKKFNFVNDLVELDEDVTDDEEVELALGGFEGTTRKFHRNIREFRYYYLENKQAMIIVLLVIIVVCVGGYLINTKLLNPVYKTNDTFSFEAFSFKVLNTYVTNIGYDNQEVLDDDNTFVLVKMNVINNSSDDVINDANFVLRIGSNKYSTVLVSSKFKDLGIVYRGQSIKDSATYLFAFKVPLNSAKEKMVLAFRDEKEVRLSPIYLDDVDKQIDYKLGDNIDLSDSFYGEGNLKIQSYEVASKFNYSYTYEVLEQSYEGNISISSINNIIMNLVIDSSYVSGYDDYSFLNKYAKLKYIIDDKEYTSNVFEDKTPTSYKDGLYVVVDKEIENASSMWFDIVLRNKHYVYKLK